MKDIKQSINEGVDKEYTVCFLGFTDRDGLPVRCTVYVPISMSRQFENFLEKEQDNIFAHAFGGSIDY